VRDRRKSAKVILSLGDSKHIINLPHGSIRRLDCCAAISVEIRHGGNVMTVCDLLRQIRDKIPSGSPHGSADFTRHKDAGAQVASCWSFPHVARNVLSACSTASSIPVLAISL
jgi:hypothetical protein